MSLVEKLASSGQLTPEQVERIGRNVRDFLAAADQDPTLMKEAMEKLGNPSRFRSFLDKSLEHAGNIAPVVAGSAALTALGAGAATLGRHGARAVSDSINKSRSYKAMIQENPQLEQADPNQTEKVFNTLYRLNPHYAKDPLIAGTFVRNVLDQERLDLGSVGALVQARKGMESGRRSDAEFFRGLLPGPDFPLKMEQAGRQQLEHQWKAEDRPFQHKKVVQEASEARERATEAALRRKAAEP